MFDSVKKGKFIFEVFDAIHDGEDESSAECQYRCRVRQVMAVQPFVDIGGLGRVQ